MADDAWLRLEEPGHGLDSEKVVEYCDAAAPRGRGAHRGDLPVGTGAAVAIPVGGGAALTPPMPLASNVFRLATAAEARS